MSQSMKQPELTTEARAALVDLLYRLADDGLIIGHRNSEWTGIGPILEEDIAFSSMAQDKMGHALAMYRLLHELGEDEPDRLAFMRDATAFRCCSLVALPCVPEDAPAQVDDLSNNPTRDRLVAHGDWAIALVRQFLFSEADAMRMRTLVECSYAPLAQLVRKLQGEIKYHTLHGRMMLRHGATASEEARQRLQRALDVLWPHALGMFEPTDADPALAKAEICPREAELCEQWRGVVEPMLADVGLNAPQDAKPEHGGRRGKHGPALAALLADMQKVARLDPAATW